MGMLNKHPLKSLVFKRFCTPTKTPYTEDQKKHAVALYWTPELPRSWIRWQFEQHSERNPDHIMQTIKNFAYNPYYREKWGHLGAENLKYIGLAEVDAFYARFKPGARKRLPSWAIMVINDLIKQGWTKKAIARRFGLGYEQFVVTLRRKSIFDPITVFNQNSNWGTIGHRIPKPPKHPVKPKKRKKRNVKNDMGQKAQN
jgi:hypothetical protein